MVSAERMQALLCWQAANGTAVDLAELERKRGRPLEWLLQTECAVPARLLDARSSEAAAWAVATQERCAELGITIMAGEDAPVLARLPIPPLLLYVRGDMQAGASLGVVGSRTASAYGLRTTERICSELAAGGITIVSGLARGIDAAAHRAALEAGGRTVAVLGCGLDIAYPREHRSLMEEIANNGGLLSEWPPGVPPLPHHFPQRNRLLVALSSALLVVEARIRSGTFTSVRWAADLGCQVLVVPGPVDAPLAEGALQLLRDGATPVGNAAHVLEALGIATAEQAAAPGLARGLSPAQSTMLSAQETRVLALLGAECLDLDEIVRGLAEAPGSLLATLMSMELRGLVARDDSFAWRALRLPERAVTDGEVEHPVQDQGDADEHDHSCDEVAQPMAQGNAHAVAPGDCSDEVHHQEERKEEQEGFEEAHGF